MKFTLEEFFEQVLYFHDLMGSKSFWVKSDGFRLAAVDGLTFVYRNTRPDNPKDEEILLNTFTATISEYNQKLETILLSELAPA